MTEGSITEIHKVMNGREKVIYKLLFTIHNTKAREHPGKL